MTKADEQIAPTDLYSIVVAALKSVDAVSVSDLRGFGNGGLMLHGKLFAVLRGSSLLLKLPAKRVEALVASGDGEPFDAGKGRPMREWVTVPQDSPAKWLALSHEALNFVRTTTEK